MSLKVGQRVRFRPTHQKELELTGKVQEINSDSVVVESDAGNGSVSRVYAVHANDCAAIEEAEQEQAAAEQAGPILVKGESDAQEEEAPPPKKKSGSK